MKDLIDELRQTLPPVFTRQTASNALGGLLSAKRLANLDALRLGPPERIKIGGKVGYRRETFLIWLANRQAK